MRDLRTRRGCAIVVMNLLGRLIGGVAGATSFPYNIGDVVASYNGKSLWSLHKGTKKEDGSPVSIFAFDVKRSPYKVDVAKNGFKRAKTIRHPNVLTFLDGLETESVIYIVTELVVPLEDKLEELREYQNSISWGIYEVTKAISFIGNDCNLVHGNISPSAIFITKAGDWKLSGLDLVCDLKDQNCLLKNHNDMMEKLYKPPEVTKGLWQQIHTTPGWCIDIWMLGCLIYEVYNGKLSRQDELKNFGKIPKVLHQQYQQIFSANPTSRLNPKVLLESKYFSNPFVDTCVFLENITLKDNFEKENFFKKLDKLLDEFPADVCKYKVLPHLINALDYGSANPRVLGPLLKIGGHLTAEEYAQKVTPSVVKWFGSNDRALRINLLENLENFASHLTPQLINDQIFPNVVNGFTDLSPVLRELTVKAMLHLAPKMSEKVLSQEMLKYFAKLIRTDQEPGIRTNTTICLGKIAVYLSEDTRKRVLIPAFSIATRDPFPHARIAGLLAFTATQDYYSREDCAVKVIPCISPMLIDPEKEVRKTAQQSIKIFLKRVEKLSVGMDVGAPEGGPGQVGAGASNPIPQSSGMLGWAINTLSHKVYGGAIENPNIMAQTSPKTPGGVASPTTPANNQKPPSREDEFDELPPKKAPAKAKDGWDDFGDEDMNEEEEERYFEERLANSRISAKPPSSTPSKPATSQSPSTASAPKPLVLGKPQNKPSTSSTPASTTPPTSARSPTSSKFGYDEDLPTSGSAWGDEFDDIEPPKPKKEPIIKPIAKKEPKIEHDNKPAPAAKKSSDGWDNDGWDNDDGGGDDEGWDKFEAPSANSKTASAASSSERKLTKLELAQLKKEEAAKRRK